MTPITILSLLLSAKGETGKGGGGVPFHLYETVNFILMYFTTCEYLHGCLKPLWLGTNADKWLLVLLLSIRVHTQKYFGNKNQNCVRKVLF